MKKIYKNDIHRIIKEEVNLDPNQFKIIEEVLHDNHVASLLSIDNKMCFKFLNPPTSWDVFQISFTLFNPTFTRTGWTPQSNYLSYGETKIKFIEWLRTHAKSYVDDIQGIDNWTPFQFETNIFQLSQIPIDDKSNFTIDDSEKIFNSIDNLKQLLIDKFEPTEIQLAFINERLNYLSESTNRLNKYDWSNLLISVFMSIAINMSFDTETGRRFFDLINQAFKNVKYLLGQ